MRPYCLPTRRLKNNSTDRTHAHTRVIMTDKEKLAVFPTSGDRLTGRRLRSNHGLLANLASTLSTRPHHPPFDTSLVSLFLSPTWGGGFSLMWKCRNTSGYLPLQVTTHCVFSSKTCNFSRIFSFRVVGHTDFLVLKHVSTCFPYKTIRASYRLIRTWYHTRLTDWVVADCNVGTPFCLASTAMIIQKKLVQRFRELSQNSIINPVRTYIHACIHIYIHK
jgi:hypothetical protein